MGSLSTQTIRASGFGRMGDLVRIAGRRDAGADVEELPDASGAGQVPDRAGEKSPLSPDTTTESRPSGQRPLDRLPVDGEVALPAKPVVIDPRLMRPGRIDADREP
jgi:hypothetical protein